MTGTTAVIVAACITSLPASAAVVLAVLARKKIQEIHVMVNNRLDAALAQIADLKEQRDKVAKDKRESSRPGP